MLGFEGLTFSETYPAAPCFPPASHHRVTDVGLASRHFGGEDEVGAITIRINIKYAFFVSAASLFFSLTSTSAFL